MGACSASFTSEIQGAIAIAAPDHHRDRETEDSSEGCPGTDTLVLNISFIKDSLVALIALFGSFSSFVTRP